MPFIYWTVKYSRKQQKVFWLFGIFDGCEKFYCGPWSWSLIAVTVCVEIISYISGYTIRKCKKSAKAAVVISFQFHDFCVAVSHPVQPASRHTLRQAAPISLLLLNSVRPPHSSWLISSTESHIVPFPFSDILIVHPASVDFFNIMHSLTSWYLPMTIPSQWPSRNLLRISLHWDLVWSDFAFWIKNLMSSS